jgi:hypothetical protein
MVDFDSYIEEAVDTVDKKVSGGMSAASSYTRAYYTGYIYGLRASKKIFEAYERDARGEQESVPDEPVQYVDDMYDDADALASAGHGTDEDYGYYGEEY